MRKTSEDVNLLENFHVVNNIGKPCSHMDGVSLVISFSILHGMRLSFVVW